MGVGSSLHNEPYQKRSVVEGSCRVTIQPSDDTQTPLHGMKRPAGGVGRGFKHPAARVVRAEECFVWFLSACCEAGAGRRRSGFALHMWISRHSEILHLSWGRVRGGGGPRQPLPTLLHFPSRLKNQIMNSLFQREAIRTECPFKFGLITNNLHLHSREL